MAERYAGLSRNGAEVRIKSRTITEENVEIFNQIMANYDVNLAPNMVYNLLTIIERVDDYIAPSGVHFSKYLCECKCGNRKAILGDSLVSGHTKSCGCLMHRPKVLDETMLGQRFGLLKVESRAPSHRIPSGSVYDMWNCVCECGNHTVSFGRNLRNMRNTSCGCMRVKRQAEAKQAPKAEEWAKSYFKDQGIIYEYQKTFGELVSEKGGFLSYDFWFPEYKLLLELNGLQHYKPVPWFGGEAFLEKQQQRDLQKLDYAKNHGYLLIVVDTHQISEKNLIKKLNAIFLNEI